MDRRTIASRNYLGGRKMSKRSNAEGSIYRRKDGKWVGALTIGFDGKGKQKRKYYYGKTKKEVQEKLVKALHLQQKGQLTLKSLENITVEKWLDTWLVDYKQNAVKPRTLLSYKNTIELYINPNLGNMQLKSLTTNQIQKAVNNLSLKVSPRTVQYSITILRQALKQALLEGYIFSNPALHISLPRVVTGQIKALNKQEVEKVFAVIENPIHYVIYFTLLSTGIRRGEILALRWQDIDLKKRIISINYAVTKNRKGEWVVDTPKTQNSIRSFSISAELASMLKKHQVEQNKQILQAGSLYNNQDFIYCKDNGERYNPDHITRRYKKYCKKVGIYSNLHELRHTFATFALQSGMDITTVSKMLGHQNVTTTLNTYSHLLPDSTEKVAETVSLLLPKRKYPT